MFDLLLERSLFVVLLLFAGCTRDIAPDVAIAHGDTDASVLAALERLGARDITDGLSLGYDPNGERNANPDQNYWRTWMLDDPKRVIETTFVDGALAHLLFWDLRDREIDHYFSVMPHDEVSSISVWLGDDRWTVSIVERHNQG